MSVFLINTFFSMCLQAGCEWVWLDSGQDSHDDSELSNDCRSLLSSWDSSLDLDVGSWKDTEDAEAEADEPEESSPERGCSELLVGDVESEEAREEAEQGTPQELLSEVMVKEATVSVASPSLPSPPSPLALPPPLPFSCLSF